MPVDLLAIAAHRDDVELTCAGTLLKARAQGYQTGILDLTAGESGTRGSADLRAAEKIADDYFIRVSVVSGGCSGLSYKLDFDNESKPNDQVFEDNGIKVVTDLKSFLYLFNTTLEFSGGLNGKGFHFDNPNATRTCGCGESFAV